MMPQMFTESQTAFASVNDATAQHDLGTLAWSYDSTWKSWKCHKYVQLTGAVNAAAGSVSLLGSTAGTVTCDVNSDNLTGSFQFGGVFEGVVTADYYGWVVVGGTVDCTGDAVINAGEAVVPAAAVDGQMDTMADGEEEQVFGWALEDATTSAPTIAVRINGIYI